MDEYLAPIVKVGLAADLDLMHDDRRAQLDLDGVAAEVLLLPRGVPSRL